MKKSLPKKLNLNRETLRNLDEMKLTEVAGGFTLASCENSCDPGSSVKFCPHTCDC